MSGFEDKTSIHKDIHEGKLLPAQAVEKTTNAAKKNAHTFHRAVLALS
jgi:hypothetical protein